MTKLNEINAASAAAGNKTGAKAAQASAPTMLVLDTTAKDAPRVHEMPVNDTVKPFTFEPGKGLELPVPIAIKFLKHEAFKRVDAKGNLLPWQRRPKQPDELGAGEAIKVAENETIARVDELSTDSLLQRALEMPGGERFASHGDRKEMIDFIVETTIARNKAKLAKEPDIVGDAFTPEPEAEEEAA